MNNQYTIGIPRALLYYKYHDLWQKFFENLGCKIVYSRKSDQEILNEGVKKGIDEMCLSLKLFLGHVASLEGLCDFVLVPRINSLKRGEKLCTNFSALYDLTRNLFPDMKIIHYNVDVDHHDSELFAFLDMGKELGFSYFDSMSAYRDALHYQKQQQTLKLKKQAEQLRSNKIKILMVAHPYNLHDELIGKQVQTLLEKEGVAIIYSDCYDESNLEEEAKVISPKSYWTYNQELLGAIVHYKKRVDGIILLTTFPCGPDSLTNEMCLHKIKDKPIINLIIDELNSENGLTTRIESFIDIIREKKKRRDPVGK